MSISLIVKPFQNEQHQQCTEHFKVVMNSVKVLVVFYTILETVL